MAKAKKIEVMYNIELTGDTHIHVSEGNDKLGNGIYNISLLPGDKNLTLKNGTVLTNVTGSCEGCCKNCSKDCYAKKSAIRYHNSCIPAWGENTVLAKYDMETYFREIDNYLRKSWIGCWRWHVAGEIPSYEYLEEMNNLAVKYDYIRFYFYSKRYEWLEKLETTKGFAKNLVPTVSTGWEQNDYDNPYKFHEFCLDRDGNAKGIHCPAVDKHGNKTGVTCSTCRRCPLAERESKTLVYLH